MKNLIDGIFLIYLLFFLNPVISFCQITGKVEYVSILESEDFKELNSALFFSDSESFFFVDTKNEESAIEGEEQIYFEDESNLVFELDFTDKSPRKYEVYLSRSNQTILSQNSIFKDLSTVPCVVLEETGTINWKLHEEFKEIGEFKTQKATTSFRGRDYNAWFTTEVPIEIGPWKFHGLPGLILEVRDSELGVQFLFTSLKIPYDVSDKIVKPNNGDVILIDEFAKYQDNFSKELITLFRAKMPRSMGAVDISFNEVVKSIEREY